MLLLLVELLLLEVEVLLELELLLVCGRTYSELERD